ncbi:MAG: cation transporter [Actinomycetota bacterium]|nr:cation transporter [Actinomycetota bacterium]
MSLELEISGMTCETCARHVSDALLRAGAADAQVDWRAGRATVEPNGTSKAELASALDATAYGVLRIVDPRSPGRRIDYSALPRITFTNPTVASAGLTEAQAQEQGLGCESRTLELEHVPRAIVSRNVRGLVKLLAERDSGRIVGVHIVGDGAGDVILAGSLAIQTGMTVDQLAAGWNPYLTLAEGLYLAAQSFHRDPSKLSCCAA